MKGQELNSRRERSNGWKSRRRSDESLMCIDVDWIVACREENERVRRDVNIEGWGKTRWPD